MKPPSIAITRCRWRPTRERALGPGLIRLTKPSEAPRAAAAVAGIVGLVPQNEFIIDEQLSSIARSARRSDGSDGTTFASLGLKWVQRKIMQSSDLDDRRALLGRRILLEIGDRAGCRFSIAESLTWIIFCPQSAIVAERASSGCPRFQRGRE
jgi:hypothetical protein